MIDLLYCTIKALFNIVFLLLFVEVGKEEHSMPYLLYLQGGPGFECQRPTESSGWIHKACEEYRVVLMDQVGFSLFLCA